MNERPHLSAAAVSDAQYTRQMRSIARHLLAFLLCLSLLNNGMGAAWAAAWNPGSGCSHASAAGPEVRPDSGQSTAAHAMHDGMHHDSMRHDGMLHGGMHHTGMSHTDMPHEDRPLAGMTHASGHCGACESGADTTPDVPASPVSPDCGCNADGCACLIAGMAVLWPAVSLPALAHLPQGMPARLHPQAHPAPPLPYPLRPPIH